MSNIEESNSNDLPKIVEDHSEGSVKIICRDGSVGILSTFEALCYRANIYTAEFLETIYQGQNEPCRGW